MKMKKVLPILMAAVLTTASLPMMANASDASSQTESSTESSESTGNSSNSEKSSSSESEAEDVASDTQDKDTAGDNSDNSENTKDSTADTTDTDAEDSTDETEVIEGDQVDTDNVVTLGENLTTEQRDAMYKYFGTSADKVRTIIVTHSDEVKYMEGIATAEQIGNTTNSCAYVEPTNSGGIKVKTANLNFVTSAMIASTLTTAGMENCNVIAACPFEVSGTGALTGIIMAYETASGEKLDEGKKEAAMEELITTGDLADSIGSEEATQVVGEVKEEILDKGLTDPDEIGDAVDKIAEKHDVTLTDDQKQQLVSLMEKISQYDYDLDSIKDTLNNLSGKVGALEGVWNSVKSFFVGSGDGILNDTDDSALGSDIITDSNVDVSGFKDGLLTRIINFFKGE
ncbi:DUF1002 domain-containing protein [Dorea ammoniilytica]